MNIKDLTNSQIQSIRVICQKSDGLGDVVFCCKTAEFIKKRFPHLTVSMEGIDENSHSDLLKFLQKTPIQGVSVPATVEDPNRFSVERVAQTIFLHGPYLNKGLNLPFYVPSERILHLAEYSNETCVDKKNKPTLTSGLGEEEMGIFCPDQDAIRKVSDEYQNNILKNLQGLDNVYIGYGSEYRTVANYIIMVLLAETDSTKPIDICIPGYRFLENPQAFSRLLNELFNAICNLKPDLKEVDVILPESFKDLITPSYRRLFDYFSVKPRYEQGMCTLPFKMENGGSKGIRLIFPGTLPETDFDLLRRNSGEHYSLVTGDQSFSEHLGIPCIYEVRSHKNKFFYHLIQICKKHELALLSDFFMQSKELLRLDDPLEVKEMGQRFLEIWANPELKKQARRLKDIIAREHNIEDQLVIELQKRFHLGPVEQEVIVKDQSVLYASIVTGFCALAIYFIWKYVVERGEDL